MGHGADVVDWAWLINAMMLLGELERRPNVLAQAIGLACRPCCALQYIKHLISLGRDR